MEKKNKTTKILMHDIPLRLIKVLNIICLTIPFAGCWYGYYSGQMKDGFYNRGNLLMIALFMLVYFLFARIYNAFLISVNRISEMVYSQVLAALITDGISYLHCTACKRLSQYHTGSHGHCRSDSNVTDLVFPGSSLVLQKLPAAEDNDRLRCQRRNGEAYRSVRSGMQI